MSKPILSIIVPVYNVQNYLEECYNSIYNNEIINKLEIILVDDGSTDNSSKICDKLDKNENTKVYHKKNGGLASARNYGLDKAIGRYVTFLDSDDKIDSMSLPKIISYLITVEDKDLIFLNIKKFYNNGAVEDMGENIRKAFLENTNKNKCIEYISSRPKFPASACAKIYRKEFLKSNNIRFPDDNRISEDMGFSFKCLLLANTFDKIELPYYYYRQNRENSITSKITIKSFDGLSQFIVDSINLYTKNGVPKDNNIKNLFNFLSYEYSILLWHYNFLEKKYQKQAYIFLKNYNFVMKWSKTKRNKIIYMLLKVFGIKSTAKIIYIIK